MPNLELTFIGFAVGALIGLTGVGGGVLMTPILIFTMGIPPSIAIGTDLLYAAITKTIGAIQHLDLETVDSSIVACLAIGSVPAVLVGTSLVKVIKELKGDAAENILTQILAGTLILVAIVMVTRIVLNRRMDSQAVTKSALSPSRRRMFTVLLGVASGLLVGLTSIGAGSLVMMFLVLLYAMPSKRLVGTDLLHAAILASIAALGHLLAGNVDMSVATMLLLGSIPGVILGSRLSVRVPDNVLRLMLALALIFSGIRLIGTV